MLPTLTRRYLTRVRPRRNETIASYSRRLLSANSETEAHREHLTSLVTSSKARSDREKAWADVLRLKTDRPSLDLETPSEAPTVHPDNEVCPRCFDALRERRMCMLCAHGDNVTLHGVFENPVCAHHHRWVGLHGGSQVAVNDEYVGAAKVFDKLVRAKRLDWRLYNILLRAFHQADGVNELTLSGLERTHFVEVVSLVKELTRQEFLFQLFDPQSAIGQHAQLGTLVTRTIGRMEIGVTNALWQYLLPSFAALRGAWICGTEYQPHHPHDFVVPDTVVQRYLVRPAESSVPRADQAQPFEDYFAASGDDEQSLLNSEAGRTRVFERLTTSRAQLGMLCQHGHLTAIPVLLDTGGLVRGRPSCMVCSGMHVVPGFNDLNTVEPRIAGELDEVLSCCSATQVSRASSRELAWKCRAGHRYWATVSNRVLNRTGCPYCHGTRVLPGVTDLSTTHPHVASELDSHSRSAFSLTSRSDYNAGWACSSGHSYRMRVYERVALEQCPVCTREANMVGHNITATHSDIAAQWHPTKNKHLCPEHFTHGSGTTVWWLCHHGHDYQAKVERRTAGAGCPVCAGRRLVKGVNDLASREPVMVLEFHPWLNGPLEPDEVFPSDTRFWWRCLEAGHVLQQTVQHRRQSAGCTDCQKEDRILIRRK
jgi:hypothetical protein